MCRICFQRLEECRPARLWLRGICHFACMARTFWILYHWLQQL